MKVKNKLFLSLMFLFGVILLLGGMGSYYLYWLAEDSRAIIQDNYRSLIYMRKMETALNTMADQIFLLDSDTTVWAENRELLEENFLLQSQNVTEPNEEELTRQLGKSLEELKEFYDLPVSAKKAHFRQNQYILISDLRRQIGNIYLINEQTILRKNATAGETAEKVVFYMTVVSAGSLIVGLIFIIGLPIYISRPLSEFNDAIREVSRGNYRISLSRRSKDEFGELAESFNKMAAKLDEYEHSNLAQLLREKKRLDAVIDQMDEVILGLDDKRHIIFANQHCLNLLNYPKEKLMGKYAPDVAMKNELMKNLIGDLEEYISSEEDSVEKSLRIVEEKKEKVFSKNIVAVTGQQTGETSVSTIGYLIILTDITGFTEKDKAKTHFIATLSHELKTPVAAIQMGVNLLKNEKTGQLSPDQMEMLATIGENNNRIRRMINEILDISRIESGVIDVLIAAENPEELVNRAIDGVKVFLQEKNILVQKTVEPDLPEIHVDAHKTVWILNNFLTNAIRYSPPGGTIIVSAKVQGKKVYLSVSDSGPGIPLENQPQIFLKFTRLSTTESGGTGLGLAISREFIRAMGGDIGVDSQPGAGATFWVLCQ
ncbi:MAG: ATP-binding protein [Bacteroidia bacterium]|nr:ATP-binding protein [Bacteroidia bacterium]